MGKPVHHGVNVKKFPVGITSNSLSLAFCVLTLLDVGHVASLKVSRKTCETRAANMCFRKKLCQ